MDSRWTIHTCSCTYSILTTNESKNAHINDGNDNGTNMTANSSNNIDNTTKHIVTIAAISNNGLINTKVLGHIEYAKERAIYRYWQTQTHTLPPKSRIS